MLDKVKDLMGDKETAKATFIILKSQLRNQLEMSKNSLKNILQSEELNEEDTAVFKELDTSIDHTAGCLEQVIDIIIKKVDESE